MSKFIPNELSQVVFVPDGGIANIDAPTVAEINGGTNITGFVVSCDPATTGQTVATPALDSLFETNIPGTVTADFSMECYRDDAADTAWDTLPRGTAGFIVIARFGFGGATVEDPAAGDEVEVWPIRVTTRSATGLTNNESQRFNVEAAIPEEPAEDAVVAA